MGMTFDELVAWYAECYPGFPPMVHHIMAHTTQGKTPKEAAEAVGVYAEQIEKGVQTISETHATYTPDGEFELPSKLPQIEEVSEEAPVPGV